MADFGDGGGAGPIRPPHVRPWGRPPASPLSLGFIRKMVFITSVRIDIFVSFSGGTPPLLQL